MNRRWHLLLLGLWPLSLTACVQTAHNLNETGHYFVDDFGKSIDRVREYVSVPDKPLPKAPPVKPSYCYRVMQDIICYDNPKPGAESRLVAYQGPGANPPVPSVTPPASAVVVEKVEVKKVEVRKTMEETSAKDDHGLPPLKPVFVSPPPSVTTDGLSGGNAHENPSQALF
jgi:hypothetical protein